MKVKEYRIENHSTGEVLVTKAGDHDGVFPADWLQQLAIYAARGDKIAVIYTYEDGTDEIMFSNGLATLA